MTHFAIVWHICGLLGNVTPNVYFIKNNCIFCLWCGNVFLYINNLFCENILTIYS